MTLASKIANMLQNKGYNGHYPWTGSNGGYSRIYYKTGYIELSGNNGFQVIDIDDKNFVQACKDCVTEYIASKNKEVPNYALPF